MYFTLIGVLLGAVVSWLITHTYYKVSLAKSARSDPVPILLALSKEIARLKEDIARHPAEPALPADSLDKMQKYVTHLNYVFRHSLQALFGSISYLKTMIEDENQEGIRKQIRELEGLMRKIGNSVREENIEGLPAQLESKTSGDSTQDAPDDF